MLRALSVVSVLLLLLACDSENDGGSSGGTTQNPSSIPAFSGYCTGVLKTEKTGMLSDGPFAWVSYPGHQSTLPPGTEILLGSSFDKIEGYALLLDGSFSRVKADFQTGLLKDTDFLSDCPLTGQSEQVLLKRSTFFADAALSGQGCAVDAGAVFTAFSAVSSGSPGGSGNNGPSVAQVKSAKIQEICGLETAYSSDMIRGDLLKK